MVWFGCLPRRQSIQPAEPAVPGFRALQRGCCPREAQISALEHGDAPDDLLDQRERIALAFADEASDAQQVSDETFTRICEQLPARQVLELLLTAGCFRMMSRLVAILELEQEPSFGVDTLRRAREPALSG